jgi:phosphotriesterase-related protein
MAVIRTVLGDIDAGRAGVTLAHEHILYAYPGADLDHRTQFDFEEVAQRIGGVLRSGLDDNSVATIVEMTPVEVYRHPPLFRAVSERSGVNIIAVTGFFPESMGIPYYWRRQTVEELTDFFVTDLTEGMMFQARQTGIRAGAIKIATGGEGVATTPSPVGEHGRRITKIEDRIIRAAARAQRAVGCAINTHTDPNDYSVTNPGIEQLDILEEEGADLTKVIVGHALIQPRGLDQAAEICERGATVNVDHVGIPWKHDSIEQLDGLLAERVAGLVARGHAGRISMSYDRWFFNPRAKVTDLDPEFLNARVPYNHMFDSFVPRLSKLGLSDDVIRGFLVGNPKRIFEIVSA